MTTPKHSQRQMAIQLRSTGSSLKEISERLGVSKSSASTWVRHVKVSCAHKKNLANRTLAKVHAGRKAACEANRKKYGAARLSYREVGFQEAQGDPLHVAGCMLYWAEGSKSMNSVMMSNTDPALLKKFVEFLTSSMGVALEKIKFSCRVHQTPGNSSLKGCSLFWSKELGIGKSRIKVFDAKDNRGESKVKARYPNGVGRVELYDVSVVQRIYGAIEKYAGQEMPFGRK